jgi:hypothetical protein
MCKMNSYLGIIEINEDLLVFADIPPRIDCVDG